MADVVWTTCEIHFVYAMLARKALASWVPFCHEIHSPPRTGHVPNIKVASVQERQHVVDIEI